MLTSPGSGLSFFGFLLVYLFVPGTDHVSQATHFPSHTVAHTRQSQSLESMSRVFNDSLYGHAVGKVEYFFPKKKKANAATGGNGAQPVDSGAEQAASDPPEPKP
jgi:hypothetical protein